MSIIIRLRGNELCPSKGWFLGEYSRQYNTSITRHEVPFVIFCFWQDHTISGQQVFILTSAMHLPYFRMPLSRKKYLCRAKGTQWAEEKHPLLCATSLTARLKTLHGDSEHDSLLLMSDFNVSAFRCFSFRPLVCCYYSLFESLTSTVLVNVILGAFTVNHQNQIVGSPKTWKALTVVNTNCIQPY